MGKGQEICQVSSAGRRYGFLPSLRDALEPQFIPAHTLSVVPSKVDLTPFCGAVKNQGSLGACTAFAATGVLEYLYRKFKSKQPVFSPLFLYYKERELDGDLGQGDTGSFGSTAVQVIQQTGVCEESVDPYDPENFQRAPTADQLINALSWKAGAYHAMKLEDIRSCVASNYPALIGITVYDSFESGDWGHAHVMPAPNGGVLGGHELYIKGYDDGFDCGAYGIGAFSVRNSWGSDWGDKGDFWLPYSLAGKVLNEIRMQHFGTPWGIPAKAY